jgi:hypothetical protein
MKRIYRELGLPFSRACEVRTLEVAARFGKQVPNRHPELTERQKACVARLEPLAAAFGHDAPSRASGAPTGLGRPTLTPDRASDDVSS